MNPPVVAAEAEFKVQQVYSAARWVAVGQVITQIGRLGMSVVLARLLAPADFGLLTMAAVFLAVGELFSTAAIGPVIVQRRDLSEPLLRSLATLGIVVGLTLTAALAASAPLIAAFYADPRLRWIVAAMALSFVIRSVGLVPEALMQRSLQFGRLVLLDALGFLVNAALAILLALHGWGAWALALATLGAAVVRSLGLVVLSPWHVRPGFDAHELRGVLGFGSSVMGFNAVQFFARYTDRLLIGRFLGAANVGYYDYAYQFYMYPLEVVGAAVIKVMFPAYSRIREDAGQLARAFLRTNGAIALIAFPMMAGLGVLADPFVRVVLGQPWAPIVPLISILAPVAMLQSLGSTPGQLFLASGRAALRFWWSVIYTTVLVVAVLIGINWGIIGVAAAYATAMAIVLVVAFWLALRLVDLRLEALWDALKETTVVTGIMAAAVAATRLGLESLGAPAGIVLLVCIPFGVAVYVTGVRVVAPPALLDLQRLLPTKLRELRLVSMYFGTPSTVNRTR